MTSFSSLDTLSALYHQSVRTEDRPTAKRLLRLATRVPAYQGESDLWQGLSWFKAECFERAFVHLALAVERQPAQESLHALLVRCLQQGGHAALALKALEGALQRHPTASVLRQMQTPLLAILEAAGALDHDAVCARLRRSLPDITEPNELRLTLNHLAGASAAHPRASQPGPPTCVIGIVNHDPVLQQISGWVVDLSAPSRVLELELEFQHEDRPYHTRITANQPNPLLAQGGYTSTHGGFRLQLPQAIDALHVRCPDGIPLIGSPVAAIPVFTPPATSPATPQSGIKTQGKQPVDILIPVFLGRQATLKCIDSVIEHATRNRTPHRLIVLDDASPDSELTVAIKKRARQGKLQYLRHPANLGFIRNINRGMALHPDRDVVWLNADTRVHGNWLDRLRSTAYSADNVASVTPFSNNGELMSFPRVRHAAPMPTAAQQAALDDSAKRLALAPIPLETGCGFCLFIKRRALDDIGYLDEVELKRGYGEETDWCLRAHAKGWRHLGAVNVFVAHAGGKSFGPEKALRVFQNNSLLRRRYPEAERNFARYIAADPLAPARQQLSAALENGANHKARAWLHAAHEEITAPPARHNPVLATQAPTGAHLWLIADPLDHHTPPALARRWLKLARDLASRSSNEGEDATPLLLLDHDTPWEIELLATGQVLKLPQLPGLTRDDILTACGHPAAISLAGAHAPTWLTTVGTHATDAAAHPSTMPTLKPTAPRAVNT